jgi:hypothetical protein
MDFHQDFIVTLGRRCYLLQLKNIRWSEFFVYDCFRLGIRPCSRCAIALVLPQVEFG